MGLPTPWTPEHVRSIVADHAHAPLIGSADVVRVAEDVDVWDAWPLQLRDGTPHRLADGNELWMALAAPRFDDPDERHGHARIHLFKRTGAIWTHLGPAMPDGYSPGSREWSGCALYDPSDSRVTLYFTAAGRADEQEPTFEQRLFSAYATLEPDGRCTRWHGLREVVQADPDHYMPTDGQGGIGKIKAFRDPAWFHDAASDAHYLFFAGSLARSASAWNGVVGVAMATAANPDDWRLLPPVISADGLNNELERPHVLNHRGLYYLFWSTQRHVFDPEGPTGPTGLYGMVSASLSGGWRPLNGSGLVFANPESAPAQAYSWWVLPDLSVASFVDNWGDDPLRRFGGTFAPFLRLELDGDRAGLARSA